MTEEKAHHHLAHIESIPHNTVSLQPKHNDVYHLNFYKIIQKVLSQLAPSFVNPPFTFSDLETSFWDADSFDQLEKVRWLFGWFSQPRVTLLTSAPKRHDSIFSTYLHTLDPLSHDHSSSLYANQERDEVKFRSQKSNKYPSHTYVYLENQVEQAINECGIVLLVGPRHCGKSLLVQRCIAKINSQRLIFNWRQREILKHHDKHHVDCHHHSTTPLKKTLVMIHLDALVTQNSLQFIRNMIEQLESIQAKLNSSPFHQRVDEENLNLLMLSKCSYSDGESSRIQLKTTQPLAVPIGQTAQTLKWAQPKLDQIMDHLDSASFYSLRETSKSQSSCSSRYSTFSYALTLEENERIIQKVTKTHHLVVVIDNFELLALHQQTLLYTLLEMLNHGSQFGTNYESDSMHGNATSVAEAMNNNHPKQSFSSLESSKSLPNSLPIDSFINQEDFDCKSTSTLQSPTLDSSYCRNISIVFITTRLDHDAFLEKRITSRFTKPPIIVSPPENLKTMLMIIMEHLLILPIPGRLRKAQLESLYRPRQKRKNQGEERVEVEKRIKIQADDLCSVMASTQSSQNPDKMDEATNDIEMKSEHQHGSHQNDSTESEMSNTASSKPSSQLDLTSTCLLGDGNSHAHINLQRGEPSNICSNDDQLVENQRSEVSLSSRNQSELEIEPMTILNCPKNPESIETSLNRMAMDDQNIDQKPMTHHSPQPKKQFQLSQVEQDQPSDSFSGINLSPDLSETLDPEKSNSPKEDQSYHIIDPKIEEYAKSVVLWNESVINLFASASWDMMNWLNEFFQFSQCIGDWVNLFRVAILLLSNHPSNCFLSESSIQSATRVINVDSRTKLLSSCSILELFLVIEMFRLETQVQLGREKRSFHLPDINLAVGSKASNQLKNRFSSSDYKPNQEESKKKSEIDHVHATDPSSTIEDEMDSIVIDNYKDHVDRKKRTRSIIPSTTSGHVNQTHSSVLYLRSYNFEMVFKGYLTFIESDISLRKLKYSRIHCKKALENLLHMHLVTFESRHEIKQSNINYKYVQIKSHCDRDISRDYALVPYAPLKLMVTQEQIRFALRVNNINSLALERFNRIR